MTTTTPTPTPHDLLTAPVRETVTSLHRAFEPRRRELLSGRADQAMRIRRGEDLSVLSETEALRVDDTWRVRPAPADLARRSVELAGPATAQQARVACSSGADTWVADLEDALVPTWERMVAAHRAIGDYVRHTGPHQPTLVVRPRGLHLQEAHVRVDAEVVAASLVDTVLFVAHQGRALLVRGSAPYLYLPKLEHHAEATWWDDLLGRLESLLGLPQHTIRVSVLVETAPAAYQLEEIVHALRHRVTALTAGRYDYLASHLHLYAERPDHVLPDREALTMSTRFLRTYAEVIVHTAHRRGVQAIGGPVAYVPCGVRDDATHRALARVRADKTREAGQGFDGAWVLHPALVPVAQHAFAQGASHPARSGPRRPASSSAPDGRLLGDVTEITAPPTLAGLRTNVRSCLRYLTGWLSGQGTCELDGHLEDLGTVELARLQVWQWTHHGVALAEGPRVTSTLTTRILTEEVAVLRRLRPGDAGRVAAAAQLLRDSFAQQRPAAFLSPAAYAVLLADGTGAVAPAA